MYNQLLLHIWNTFNTFLDCLYDFVQQVLIWTNHNIQVNFDLYVNILHILFLQVLLVFHGHSEAQERVSSESLQKPLKNLVIPFRMAQLYGTQVCGQVIFELFYNIIFEYLFVKTHCIRPEVVSQIQLPNLHISRFETLKEHIFMLPISEFAICHLACIYTLLIDHPL